MDLLCGLTRVSIYGGGLLGQFRYYASLLALAGEEVIKFTR